uniref:Uncharacterized protein n=1 Tax=Ditylenchus dipsaci TaxID=166011 RepID=A0A915E3J4_9BILA
MRYIDRFCGRSNNSKTKKQQLSSSASVEIDGSAEVPQKPHPPLPLLVTSAVRPALTPRPSVPKLPDRPCQPPPVMHHPKISDRSVSTEVPARIGSSCATDPCTSQTNTQHSAALPAARRTSKIQLVVNKIIADANMGDQRRFEVTYEDQSYIVDINSKLSRPFTLYRRQESTTSASGGGAPRSSNCSSTASSSTHLPNMSSNTKNSSSQRQGVFRRPSSHNQPFNGTPSIEENKPCTSEFQTDSAVNAIKKWV